MDRHRLIWYFLRNRTNLFDGRQKHMLHVAPEVSFVPRLKKVSGLNYLTADLMDPTVMIRMDITDIQFPDKSFDIVYCSHVLEHVPNDRKAMREFRRVLKPDGWAAVMVPVTVDRTIEDPNCTDPAERERRFGQHDHFRTYGPDFADRLAESGFHVRTFRALDLMSRHDQHRFGIPDRSTVFYCRPE
jgi:SAM-dependent methyltransferase